ncbi:MAG: hypothetical protein LKF75_05405 [Bacilli bacterium]|jgi:hypothetical protein|nr:hypothetical protein [Bacilli bacterium]MCH4210653.1 hypothetical protein [Bacilli bacterium]MCH4229108.1 hypothetical protein [Bacilli bacterium]MCI2055141.1 hypothetical protein [Bacilli bacterium]
MFNRANRKDESAKDETVNDTYGEVLAKLAKSSNPIFSDEDDSLNSNR